MKRLPYEAQARAKTFLEQYARPLEQRILRLRIRAGAKRRDFRGAGGGFGNALEPDLRLSDSSVLATTVGLQVLREFDAPDSPFAGVLGDVVAQNLDFQIADQGDDGAWHPKWSWYGLYPDIWPTAEREWAAAITLRTLKTLQNLGRLE